MLQNYLKLGYNLGMCVNFIYHNFLDFLNKSEAPCSEFFDDFS